MARKKLPDLLQQMFKTRLRDITRRGLAVPAL